ncbi:MAG TPA: methionine adenosyltransferase [Gemmatimonadaceae bacterium]|nr:methionine adenosyltransferase [Gemmatimonadota bacterium]MBK7835890.1 methionine adenosyltransferase [Gemmatimonadota bacterium]MBK9407929.1 methionine adenosyltransferase [Gemmatimonadota bacterium]MBK9979049.1 methionine adenosyltransferase [Gemmatimonadota bacterium]HPV75560.1 methionine adenosyltransferase [Gemmatimonadaceae bacterium]
MAERHLFTSESVTEGHPDKVADAISDAVLDELLRSDPHSRVACETMVTTGLATIFGEITTSAWVDLREVVRNTIKRIGYTEAGIGFDADSCGVLNAIGRQSRDIAQGVDTGGAGDQGMMFGYACDETAELMPLPITIAHRLTEALAERRRDGTLPWLRPDGKSQVTVLYEDGRPVEIETVVISTQHADTVSNAKLHAGVTKEIIEAVIPVELRARRMKKYINPTGRFVIGGPHGDAGLTGRKIIVDTYGGMGRHGGGAFSGKDPSKVDRSAAYAARWVAKNIVAAKLASRVEVQLAYAIGVAEPVSIMVDSFGTGTVSDTKITQAVREVFKLTPRDIMHALDLRKPIYSPTSAYGHFGRTPQKVGRGKQAATTFSWERLDKVADLKRAVR